MRIHRRNRVKISSLLILLGVLIIGGYLAAPLFYDRDVDEPFPTAALALPSAATAPTDDMPADAMATATLLASGQFYPMEHEGEGTASIYRLEDGSLILRFEDFYVLNGPDLHVYLTSANPIPATVGADLPDFLDLGPLKGNQGDQNYTLSPDLDIARYVSVVIWCVPFKVPFSGATVSAR